VPPRRLQPAVPRDLETICLCCLEKEPAKRYGSARALADDLGRYLSGEPILARPVGALGRAWRWCQRHPALSVGYGLAAVGIVTTVVLAVALAIQQTIAAEDLREEQQATEKARQNALAEAKSARIARGAALAEAKAAQEARRQAAEEAWAAEAARRGAVAKAEAARRALARAERHFRQAQDAVKAMLTRVAEDRLRSVQDIAGIRKELLEEALRFYQQFLKEAADDPALRRDLAQAHGRVGNIQRALGRYRDAEKALLAGRKILAEL